MSFSNIKKIIIGLLILIVAVFVIYNFEISKVSNDKTNIEVQVSTGQNYLSISKDLKEKGLIKSTFFYKIYVKTHKLNDLQAGIYNLNKSMSVKELLNALEKGSTYNPDAFSITLPEGKNARFVASLIEKNTNNTSEQFYSVLKNNEYLDKLINKYWFLDESIKNENIYYSLEGYLFPDTYEFKNKDVSIEEIIESMLDQMGAKLSAYKTEINNSKYSLHEIITLASIIELEGASSDDRSGVAGVFYNRLEANWSLGSDVTTYYAEKVDINERELYKAEFDKVNAYNTRSSSMRGKLPVGPICNPGIESIEASINPTDHDYFYFVADKNKKTYFSKTSSEQDQVVAKLKKEGLWYEYK
ncbi:MAG: endolytic transglycosylase MltG [Bacilli bacterium]|nr:endolytic transglycosylase MltG [Bacilli bacterium]